MKHSDCHEGKVEESGRPLVVKSLQIARLTTTEELGRRRPGEGVEIVCEVRLVSVASGMGDLGER